MHSWFLFTGFINQSPTLCINFTNGEILPVHKTKSGIRSLLTNDQSTEQRQSYNSNLKTLLFLDARSANFFTSILLRKRLYCKGFFSSKWLFIVSFTSLAMSQKLFLESSDTLISQSIKPAVRSDRTNCNTILNGKYSIH